MIRMRMLLVAAPWVWGVSQCAYAEGKNRTAGNDEMVVSASSSNVEQPKAPQMVTIINRQKIEQQLRVTSASSQVLSNLLPAFSPSRQKMSGSGLC